jgi:hypothetical protein
VFKNAVTKQQPVVKAIAKLAIAVSLTHDHVVDVVRGLLREVLVLWLLGLIEGDVLGCEEHPHHARHDAGVRIAHVAADDA